MILTPEEIAAICRQAVAEYPDECCGVVLTRGAERTLIACRNEQNALHAKDPRAYPRDAKTAFSMHPQDLLRMARLEQGGYEIAVIYHSHPNAGSYFSPTDQEQALMAGEPKYPGVTHVVASVVGDRVRSIAAYRWDGRGFVRADQGELQPPPGEGAR